MKVTLRVLTAAGVTLGEREHESGSLIDAVWDLAEEYVGDDEAGYVFEAEMGEYLIRQRGVGWEDSGGEDDGREVYLGTFADMIHAMLLI